MSKQMLMIHLMFEDEKESKRFLATSRASMPVIPSGQDEYDDEELMSSDEWHNLFEQMKGTMRE